MKICVYGAASSEIANKYIMAGEELGREIAKRGHSLVFGGGKNGMMGAVARGVAEKKGDILGISPRFFEENAAEVAFEDCTEFIHTETMRERKKLLDEKSDAFVITPGGIGTLDEFFEILTLKQLGRHNKAIVIFNVDGYFDNMLKMLAISIQQRFITTSCVELFKITTTVGDTLDYLENYNPVDLDISAVKIR